MNIADAAVIVVGGGPAGLTVAIGLAQAGVPTIVVKRDTGAADQRTTALLHGSVGALSAFGLWQRCAPHAAPLRMLRIVDDTGGLLRAPEVLFRASEIGLDAFGHNIQNRYLATVLNERARALPALTLVEDEVETIHFADDMVYATVRGGGEITAQLAIGADGRRSFCRTAAGIEVRRHSYRQTALTFNIETARPHEDTATEFHTRAGPFTLVPLPGREMNVVWVMAEAEGEALLALDDVLLGEEIERRSHSIHGKTKVLPGRGVFPLAVETASRLAGPRIVLVGEAAHVVPPIGAQGLNLGLRDAATICEIVVDAYRLDDDVGNSEVTERYARMRRADVLSRTVAVDLLNRSLLSDFLPLQALRGLGLLLMDQISPLRRAAMREGAMPFASEPRLMRGEPL